jgi:hypothetical protein
MGRVRGVKGAEGAVPGENVPLQIKSPGRGRERREPVIPTPAVLGRLEGVDPNPPVRRALGVIAVLVVAQQADAVFEFGVAAFAAFLPDTIQGTTQVDLA